MTFLICCVWPTGEYHDPMNSCLLIITLFVVIRGALYIHSQHSHDNSLFWKRGITIKEESPFYGRENFHTISLCHFRAMADLFNDILSKCILTEIVYIFSCLKASYLRFNTCVIRGNHILLSTAMIQHYVLQLEVWYCRLWLGDALRSLAKKEDR